MPDTNAVFQEVLEIKADVPSFVTSLKQIEEEWNAFVGRLGDKAGPAVGVGTHAEFTKLAKDFETVALAMEQVATQVSDIARKQDVEQEQFAAKQSARVRKRVQEQKAAANEEISEAQKALAEAKRLFADTLDSYDEVEKKRREISLEQEGEAGRGGSLEEKAAASRRKDAYVSDLAAAEAIYQREQETLSLKQKTAAAEEGAAAAQRNAYAADLTAAESLYQEEQKIFVLREQEAALQQQIARSRVQPGAQSAQNSAEMNRLSKLWQEATSTANALNASGSPAETVALLQRRMTILREIVRLQQQLNQLATDEARAHREMTNEFKRRSDEAGGFFDRWIGGLKGSIVHLTRFYALMQLLNIASDLLRHTLGAPFVAIQEGVKYMRDLEKTSDELMGVLMANVKYSGDVAQNYKTGREAAEATVRAVQEAAIANHVNSEQLMGTAKALLEGGATRYVNNMKDMVDLASMFTQSLQAANVGGLAAQGAVKEIGKLFDGTADKANKFLLALKMTPVEFQKILQQAKETGNLVGLLAPKMAPFLDAVQKGRVHQQVMLDNLKLMWQRIQSQGSMPMFDYLNSALKTMSEWLEQNATKVSNLFRAFTEGLIETVRMLTGEGFLDGLTRLLLLLDRVAIHLEGLLAAVKLVYSVTKPQNGQFTDKPTIVPEDVQKAWKEYTDTKERLVAIEDRLTGKDKDRARERLWTGQFTSKDLELLYPTQEDPLQSGLRALKAAFENQNKPQPDKYDIKGITDASRTLLEKYRKDADEIQRASQKRLDSVKEALSEEAISHQNAAKQIAAITADEIDQLSKRWGTYLADRAKLQKRIAQTPVSTVDEAKAKKSDLESFDDATSTQQRAFTDNAEKINRERISADIAANREVEQARRSHARVMLAIESAQAKQELALAREQHQAGYLTDLQFLDAEIAAEKKEYENRVAIRRLEMAELRSKGPGAVDTNEYKRLQDQVTQGDREYTDQMRVFAEKRKQVLHDETLARQQFYDQQRALMLEAEQAALDITQTLRPQAGYTDQMEAMYDLRVKELDTLERQKRLEYDIATAKNTESAQTRALALELQGLENQRLTMLRDRFTEIIRSTPNAALAQPMLRSSASEALNRATAKRDDAQNAFTSGLAQHITGPTALTTKNIELLAKAAQDASEELRRVQAATRAVVGSWRELFRVSIDNFFGGDIKKSWDAAKTMTDKAGVVAGAVSAGMAQLGNAVSIFKQGYSQGGVMGGIGGVMGQFGGMVPVIGPYLQAIGGVLSFVGSMFTATAKRIAEDVKKQFQRTLDDYQNGNATLIATINALEQQRSQAIVRLSGKKGGREELDKLLPEFDQELVNLRKQQQEILVGFEDSLEVLKLHSETLEQVGKQWADINKQVKDYIGAGGDASKAAEYLSLQLENIRQTAADELEQSEQDAIQEVLKLNDLLQQRNKLEEDFKKQEFDLINQDAIERRKAGSVERGQQLAELRRQHDEQVKQLDEQIRLQTVKVDKEREVFNLSTDIEQLHRRDEELTLKALDAQISKWNDLKKLISSITMGADGIWSILPGILPSFGGASNFTIVNNFNGDIGGDPEEIGRQIGDSAYDEIMRRNRMVPSYA